MKHFALFFAIFTLSASASAVTTAKCPDAFEAVYGDHKPLVATSKITEAIATENGDRIKYSWRMLQTQNEAYTGQNKFRFVFDSKKRGVCFYRTENRAVIETREKTITAYAVLTGTDKKPILKTYITHIDHSGKGGFAKIGSNTLKYTLESKLSKYGKRGLVFKNKTAAIMVTYKKFNPSKLGKGGIRARVKLGFAFNLSAKKIKVAVKKPEEEKQTPDWADLGEEKIDSDTDIHENVSYTNEDGDASEECGFDYDSDIEIGEWHFEWSREQAQEPKADGGRWFNIFVASLIVEISGIDEDTKKNKSCSHVRSEYRFYPDLKNGMPVYFGSDKEYEN